ncbi:MAG: rod shape-determining protein MreC, partial [Pseudomonadota bacterium]
MFVFVFASLALLVLSKIEHPVVPAIRATVTTALLPVLDVASVPAQAIGRAADRAVSLSDAFAEVERLQLENQRLRQWERRAIQLERDLEALREHLRVAEEVPGRFVTGRLVADGRGPFVRSALLNVGANNGVNSGLAVVDQDGLLGRIVDVTQTAARVLYLTDVNSRIPVYAGTGSIRAILN